MKTIYKYMLLNTILRQVFGFLWYSPVLFLPAWLAAQGKTEWQPPNNPWPFVLDILGSLAVSAGMAWVIRASNTRCLIRGAGQGSLFALAFTVLPLATHYAFLELPATITLIETGKELVLGALGGAIFGFAELRAEAATSARSSCRTAPAVSVLALSASLALATSAGLSPPAAAQDAPQSSQGPAGQQPAQSAQGPAVQTGNWAAELIANTGVGYDGKSGQGGTIPRVRFDAIRFGVDTRTGLAFAKTLVVARGDLRSHTNNLYGGILSGCFESSLVASGNMGDTRPDVAEVYANCKRAAEIHTSTEADLDRDIREIYITTTLRGTPSQGMITFTAGKMSPEYFDYLQPSPAYNRISSWGARLAYRKHIGDHLFSVGVDSYADELNKLYFQYGDDLAGFTTAYSQALIREGVKLNNFRIHESQEAWVKWEKPKSNPMAPAESFLVAVGSRNEHRANYIVTDVQNHVGKLFSFNVQLARESYNERHFLDDPSVQGGGTEYRANVLIARPVTQSLIVTGRYIAQAAWGTTSPSFNYFEPGLVWHIWDAANGSSRFSLDAFGGMAFGKDGYRSPRFGVAGTYMLHRGPQPGASQTRPVESAAKTVGRFFKKLLGRTGS